MANTKSKENATTAQDVAEPVSKKYRVKANLDPNMIVVVKNGFPGTLVYKSRKTQEVFVWQEFGDEQDMELAELRNAKNSYKAFFENNWFLFDDPEVIDWLGVTKYYQHALDYDSFDSLFKKTPKEVERVASELSSGQKRAVAFRAKQLIDSGEIDSIKTITALEKGLGVELIER